MLSRAILFCFVVSSASSASISLAEKELECYAMEKVYHARSDKCYKLLTKGPCQPGEWLVLDRPKRNERNVKINPVCVKERCDEGQYYWPVTKSCVDVKDKGKLCSQSPDEELLYNVFGEGVCSCAREPPAARLNGDKRNPCYQLYTRGPCRHGEVLVLPVNDTTKATCAPDPCHKESNIRKKNGSLSKDGILAPYENGTCYELGTKGPCPDDLVFKVHASFLRPSCISLTTAIFNVQKPSCYIDENGNCHKRVNPNKRPNADKYKQELLHGLRD